MKLLMISKRGLVMVEEEMELMPNSATLGRGALPGQAFWLRQRNPGKVMNTGELALCKLIESINGHPVMVANFLVDDLMKTGSIGPKTMTAGAGFFMQYMPVLQDWVDPQWLSRYTDVAADTLRAVAAPAPLYRTPRAQRTAVCPCGSHYKVCTTHYDWLEVD